MKEFKASFQGSIFDNIEEFYKSNSSSRFENAFIVNAF